MAEIDFVIAAKRILHQYGLEAEKECEARASFYEIQKDSTTADAWRRIGKLVSRLRSG